MARAVKPSIIGVNPVGIPASLKARVQWVNWKLQWNGEKWKKPLVNPVTGKFAKVNDPTT